MVNCSHQRVDAGVPRCLSSSSFRCHRNGGSDGLSVLRLHVGLPNGPLDLDAYQQHGAADGLSGAGGTGSGTGGIIVSAKNSW